MEQSPGEVCVGANPNPVTVWRRELFFRENVSNATLPEEQEWKYSNFNSNNNNSQIIYMPAYLQASCSTGSGTS